MGADRLLVCSFYFYYTPERRICQGLFYGKYKSLFVRRLKLHSFLKNPVCISTDRIFDK